MIAKLYGREGMPNHRKIKVRLDGEAGQSFGAWCVNGLDLELRGFAQDGVAKGISGGTVVVTLDYTASDYGGEIQSVAGNNVGYGATGGTIFIGGRAGHRLGIRNSGATIVAEAAGKYACEYMTRGRVLILGPVENEIGAGMTGGELFIFDPKTEVPAKLHGKSVTVIECSHVDYEWMHPLLHQYFARTGSRQAEYILKNWADDPPRPPVAEGAAAGGRPRDGRPQDRRHQRGVGSVSGKADEVSANCQRVSENAFVERRVPRVPTFGGRELASPCWSITVQQGCQVGSSQGSHRP